jgi:hypothetical protein
MNGPRDWQHYRCPSVHGMWLVRRDLSTRTWLLALEPEQAPWTVAAEHPLCLFCGGDLEPVARLERETTLPH